VPFAQYATPLNIDYVDPGLLTRHWRSGPCRALPAGQIKWHDPDMKKPGAQGLVAGMNAARRADEQEPVTY